MSGFRVFVVYQVGAVLGYLLLVAFVVFFTAGVLAAAFAGFEAGAGVALDDDAGRAGLPLFFGASSSTSSVALRLVTLALVVEAFAVVALSLGAAALARVAFFGGI